MKTGMLLATFILLLSPVAVAEAAIPSVYTNANYLTSEHDQPLNFEQDAFGNFFGQTVTGKYFTQTNILNSYGVKLHRFAIDEAFFYITDKGTIKADSDITALSIYLSQPLG